jgi:phosphate starvation-inducible PhoH-like protein
MYFFGFLLSLFSTSGNCFKLGGNKFLHSVSRFATKNKLADDFEITKHSILPKTDNQKLYVDFLNNPDVSLILALGPAGTGKTLFACDYAIKSLISGSFNKIIITRPVISVDEELGFLPGNVNKKMDPFTRPIFDIFLQYLTQKKIDDYICSNKIEISPLAFMRGRTFKNSFIIADEMQNSSPNQMLMLSTRMGDNSKMVITGDLHQSDRYENNGLSDFLGKIDYYHKHDQERGFSSSIKSVNFEKNDVQRSQIVSDILNIYDFHKIRHFIRTDPIRTDHLNVTIPSKPKDNDCALIPIQHLMKDYTNFIDKSL